MMSKKEVSSIDREIIYLELEKSRINREKSKTVLDKSFMLYFAFLLVGVVGFAADYIDQTMLKALVIAGIIILIIGTIPYILIIAKEENFIKRKLDRLKSRK